MPVIALSQSVDDVATYLQVPTLNSLVDRFLYDQLYADDTHTSSDVPEDEWPSFYGRISVYQSARATFYAPNELAGMGGMHRETIRSSSHWRGECRRWDTVLINVDPATPGFRGMIVGRVRAFLAFTHNGIKYPCALVEWFLRQDDEPDPDTGMWIVEPEVDPQDGERIIGLVHIDSIETLQ
ncbi:hypothetical protein EIP86_002571 [Pleurotus ostreatoroseus]|nr:hypothetical protein EIP86_002571 [Pleurotus ostreatoroseus]